MSDFNSLVEQASKTNFIELSKDAINFLQKQLIYDGESKIIEEKFIFQIIYAVKNLENWFSCCLIDQTMKFNGFCIKYDEKSGNPKSGDIIEINRIKIVKLPNRNNYLFFCENVKKLKEANDIIQVNLNKIKRKSMNINKENNKINSDNGNSNSNKYIYNSPNVKNKTIKYTLYNDLLTNENIENPVFYLKCHNKLPVKEYANKSVKKEGKMQQYFFLDTEGQIITVASFGMVNINYFNNIIQQGNVYEISNLDFQRNSGEYSKNYPFIFSISRSKANIRKLEDKGDFTKIKNISQKIITKIVDMNKDKKNISLNIVGIILEDKGIMGLSSKDNQYRFLVIGDNTFHRIVVKLWTKIINPQRKFSKGDIVYITYLYYKERSLFNELGASKRTEVLFCQPSPIEQELRKFYQEHSDMYEYKNMNMVYLNSKREIPLKFIADIKNENLERINHGLNDNQTIKVYGMISNCFHMKENIHIFCKMCNKRVNANHFNSCKGKKTINFNLLLEIRDCSGFLYIKLYELMIENLTKMPLEEYIKIINENNEEKIKEINDRILYKYYVFYGKHIPSADKSHNTFQVHLFDEASKDFYKSLITK